jgi:hypothetical protein
MDPQQLICFEEDSVNMSRVTVSMQCKTGGTVHIRKSSRPEPKQQEVYSILGEKSHPDETVKTIA